jgi:hypothetical protein
MIFICNGKHNQEQMLSSSYDAVHFDLLLS